MKRVLFISAMIFVVTAFVSAQSVDVESRVGQIKKNPQVIWGEGTGNTTNAAQKNAQNALIAKIAMELQHFYPRTSNETDDHHNRKVLANVASYRLAQLNQSKRLLVSDEPNAKIFCYIEKSDMQQLFEKRKTKVLQYAQDGEKAEQHAQVADALRFYYWSLTLLHSIPDYDKIKTKDGQVLLEMLTNNINRMFGGVDACVSNITEQGQSKMIELMITYKGNPVQNYDYTYFDGNAYSELYSARDGVGVIELSDNVELSNLILKSEYIFEGESQIDEELSLAMKANDFISFTNNKVAVRSEQKKKAKQEIAEKVTENNTRRVNNEAAIFSPVADSKPYQESLQRIESAINNKDYASVKDLFAGEGYEMFLRLMQYGDAKILKHSDLNFYNSENGVIGRSLPMSFKFKGNKTFVESIVFDFDTDKKIQSLSFQLEQEAVADIAAKDRWTPEARMVIIRFLENYKTAYALERKDYIKSIFSDDALIITGSVIKTTSRVDNMNLVGQAVRYTKYTKNEYMKHLEKTFARNEFINLRFTENVVKKANSDKDVYGIQIKQDYFSSTYGDTGYLFLMVDVTEPNTPIIHVRAWQPEKDPVNGVIGIQDFVFE